MATDEPVMSADLRRQIADLIASAGVSKRKIAHRAGIDPSAITHYLSGTADPRVVTLEAIAAACGGRVVLVPDATADLSLLLGAVPADLKDVLLQLARDLPKIRSPLTIGSVRAFARLVADEARGSEDDRAAATQDERRRA